jgi:hypothetical protein
MQIGGLLELYLDAYPEPAVLPQNRIRMDNVNFARKANINLEKIQILVLHVKKTQILLQEAAVQQTAFVTLGMPGKLVVFAHNVNLENTGNCSCNVASTALFTMTCAFKKYI